MRKSFCICVFGIAILFAGPVFSADIHSAIRSGDIEKVRSILVRDPSQVKARDKSTLDFHDGKMAKYEEMLRFDFIFNIARPDVYSLDMKGYTPLMLAVIEQNMEIIDLLIAFGADVYDANKNGLNCIHLAAIGGDLVIFKRLLVQQSSRLLATRDRYGFTPLLLATAMGNFDILSFLIDSGLSVNIQDRNGITPLMYAALGDYMKITETLIAHGADINAEDKIGNIPLMYAAFRGDTGLIAYFLSVGSQLDSKNKRGVSPLIYAVIAGELRTARFLIRQGADVKGVLGQDLVIERTKKRYPKGSGLMKIAQINEDEMMINYLTRDF